MRINAIQRRDETDPYSILVIARYHLNEQCRGTLTDIGEKAGRFSRQSNIEYKLGTQVYKSHYDFHA